MDVLDEVYPNSTELFDPHLSIDPNFDEFYTWLIDPDSKNVIQIIDDLLPISATDQYGDRVFLNGDAPQLDTISETVANTTENEHGQEQLIQSEEDQLNLIAICRSFCDHNRLMSIKTEPPDYWRLRYKSDGKRHIEKSRRNPMEINIPNLNGFSLKANQSLWIGLTLITTDQNPKNRCLIHTNYLEYHETDVYQNGHASVYIPLTTSDILAGVKKLSRLSIIGMKRDDYNYELIPYDQLSTNNPPEKYTVTNANNMTSAAKAKKFIEQYNLKSCHIVCQLIIKQNDTWHMTGIDCKTRVIYEKSCETKQKNVRKRLAFESVDECQSEDENTTEPTPKLVKRPKRSRSLINQLPVVYSKTHSDDSKN